MSGKAMQWAYKLYETFDMPPQERAVLNALCFRHNASTGACSPSYQTLATMTGYRRRRVILAVQKLQTLGLVGVDKRRTNGKQGSNNFTLFGKVKREAKTGSQSAEGGTLYRVHKKAPCESADGGTLKKPPYKEEDIYPPTVIPFTARKPFQEEAFSGGQNAG